MTKPIERISDRTPSPEAAAGISLAAQVVCLKLTLDHAHNGLALVLRAVAIALVVAWMVALARGHRTSWPTRMTLVGINVGQAVGAFFVLVPLGS